eukprot:Gb_01235 [translate_table: standard]
MASAFWALAGSQRLFLKSPSDALSSKHSFQILSPPLPIKQSCGSSAFQNPTGLIAAGAIRASSSSSCSPNMTLYEVLSVGQNVGLGEIKRAYRQMARVYHPDVCPAAEREECSKMFLQIQEAYETLSDPLLRADYDYRLSRLSTPMEFNSYSPTRQRRQNMGMDQWKEQFENLERRSACASVRNTWGARMRLSRAQQAHGMY